MKVKVFNNKIELTNKYNAFLLNSNGIKEKKTELTHYDLCHELDLRNNLDVIEEDFLIPLKQAYNKLKQELFEFNKKHCLISLSSEIGILALPEDSCVYVVDYDSYKKYDSSFYRNLTPNTILTSPLFEFEDLIPESHLENERLRTEETCKQVQINDETKAFLKETAKKMKPELNNVNNYYKDVSDRILTKN